jgi:hypothetical protein
MSGLDWAGCLSACSHVCRCRTKLLRSELLLCLEEKKRMVPLCSVFFYCSFSFSLNPIYNSIFNGVHTKKANVFCVWRCFSKHWECQNLHAFAYTTIQWLVLIGTSFIICLIFGRSCRIEFCINVFILITCCRLLPKILILKLLCLCELAILCFYITIFIN